MGRTTPEDEAFKRAVAEEFRLAVDRAAKQGLSVEQFGQVLGVTRQAVYKYLNEKSIPSLRVLQRARSRFGVRLTYGELGDRYLKPAKDDGQLKLPFSLANVSKEQIQVKKFSPRGDNTADLVLRITLSKTA
jgi:transcriptional regulator with XRE-family HTH domain